MAKAVPYPGVGAINHEELQEAKHWMKAYLKHSLIQYFKNKYQDPDIEPILETINKQFRFWFKEDKTHWFGMNNLVNLAGHGLETLLGLKKQNPYTNPIKKYYEKQTKPTIYYIPPDSFRHENKDAINPKHAYKARRWFRNYLFDRVNGSIRTMACCDLFPEYHERLRKHDSEYLDKCGKVMDEMWEKTTKEITRLFGDKVRAEKIIPNLIMLVYHGLLYCMGETTRTKFYNMLPD